MLWSAVREATPEALESFLGREWMDPEASGGGGLGWRGLAYSVEKGRRRRWTLRDPVMGERWGLIAHLPFLQRRRTQGHGWRQNCGRTSSPLLTFPWFRLLTSDFVSWLRRLVCSVQPCLSSLLLTSVCSLPLLGCLASSSPRPLPRPPCTPLQEPAWDTPSLRWVSCSGSLSAPSSRSCHSEYNYLLCVRRLY